MRRTGNFRALFPKVAVLPGRARGTLRPWPVRAAQTYTMSRSPRAAPLPFAGNGKSFATACRCRPDCAREISGRSAPPEQPETSRSANSYKPSTAIKIPDLLTLRQMAPRTPFLFERQFGLYQAQVLPGELPVKFAEPASRCDLRQLDTLSCQIRIICSSFQWGWHDPLITELQHTGIPAAGQPDFVGSKFGDTLSGSAGACQRDRSKKRRVTLDMIDGSLRTLRKPQKIVFPGVIGLRLYEPYAILHVRLHVHTVGPNFHEVGLSL